MLHWQVVSSFQLEDSDEDTGTSAPRPVRAVNESHVVVTLSPDDADPPVQVEWLAEVLGVARVKRYFAPEGAGLLRDADDDSDTEDLSEDYSECCDVAFVRYFTAPKDSRKPYAELPHVPSVWHVAASSSMFEAIDPTSIVRPALVLPRLSRVPATPVASSSRDAMRSPPPVKEYLCQKRLL